MKLTIDRQEKKGTFGGTYYETFIQVTLTPEEKEAAQKIHIGGRPVFKYGNSEEESMLLVNVFKHRSREMTLYDLMGGVRAKVDSDAQLNVLALAENRVREKCKNIKNALENYISNKDAMQQGRFEEEL